MQFNMYIIKAIQNRKHQGENHDILSTDRSHWNAISQNAQYFSRRPIYYSTEIQNFDKYNTK